MRQAFVLLAVLAVAGCATENVPQPMQVASAAPIDGTKQVCTHERPTGSDIPRTVCGAPPDAGEQDAQMHQIQTQIRLQQLPFVVGSPVAPPRPN